MVERVNIVETLKTQITQYYSDLEEGKVVFEKPPSEKKGKGKKGGKKKGKK